MKEQSIGVAFEPNLYQDLSNVAAILGQSKARLVEVSLQGQRIGYENAEKRNNKARGKKIQIKAKHKQINKKKCKETQSQPSLFSDI